MDVYGMLEEIRPQVDRQIFKSLKKKGEPVQFYGMMRDYLERGGKRFRPAMCLLSFEACGGRKAEKIMPVAASLEMMHNFTLIHDDIEDGSELRRGKPCLHRTYGMPLSINAGDGLFALAFSSANATGLPAKHVVRIMDCISRMVVSLCEGQHRDISWALSDNVDVGEAEFMEMLRGKTGVLIGCAMETGAIAAGAPSGRVRALRAFGETVGVAFQIQDDILNLCGDEGKYGKEIGGDIREGKRTLMLIRTLSVATLADRQKLVEIYRRPQSKRGKPEIRTVMGLMKEYGAIDYARKRAAAMVAEARNRFDKAVPESEAKNKLRSLADFLIEREF